MHSFWQRLNALFFYSLSVLGFLSFLAAGTTYWHIDNPQVELRLERILLCVPLMPLPARARLHAACLRRSCSCTQNHLISRAVQCCALRGGT